MVALKVKWILFSIEYSNLTINSKQYKYCLFDWDGCLADTISLWYESYCEIAEENGKTFTLEDFKFISGNWKRSQEVVGAKNLDLFKLRMARSLINNSKNLKLTPNALEVLTSFHEKGVEMAVVTSSSRSILMEQLKVTKTSDFFKFLITADDTTNHKPDPEPINLALSLFDIEPSKALMIGDSEGDILSANSANVDSVWFKNKENVRFYGEPILRTAIPTYVIDNLDELKTII